MLKSLKWKESDEILLTTHSYKSVVTTTEELCNLKGFILINLFTFTLYFKLRATDTKVLWLIKT